MSTLLFLDIGGGEILLIALFILIFFGTDKLPKLMRDFGKGMNEVKQATNSIKREITNSVDDIKKDIKDQNNDLTI